MPTVAGSSIPEFIPFSFVLVPSNDSFLTGRLGAGCVCSCWENLSTPIRHLGGRKSNKFLQELVVLRALWCLSIDEDQLGRLGGECGTTYDLADDRDRAGSRDLEFAFAGPPDVALVLAVLVCEVIDAGRRVESRASLPAVGAAGRVWSPSRSG